MVAQSVCGSSGGSNQWSALDGGAAAAGIVSSCCTRSSHSLRDLRDTKPSKSLEHAMHTTTCISFGDHGLHKVVVVEGW